jgi:hypothetical protein
MENNWAAQHLETIRTLMERSALYRRALAPIVTFVGLVGIAAGVIGHISKIKNPGSFAIYWMGVGILVVAGSFFLVRRQASKQGEAFWSPPTRRVAQAMAPALFVGVVVGLYFFYFSDSHDAGFFSIPLILIWTFLYGIALHAAGFFMPRGIRLLGWGFIFTGLCIIFLLAAGGSASAFANASPHFLMGLIFGASHLAYGIYLYFTEPRKNAP